MKRQNILLGIMADVESALPSIRMERDRRTLISRALSEGDAFFTRILPTLDDGLLEGLATGSLPPVRGFGRKGSCPAFLFPLFSRVFDKQTGSILTDPCHLSIVFIRQIARSFKKISVICEPRFVNDAITRFVQTDRALCRAPSASEDVKRAFNQLYRNQLDRFRPLEAAYQHGPGAVADSEDSVARFEFSELNHGVSSILGDEFFRPSWYSVLNRPTRDSTLISRLEAVPKTALTPRLISIEPAANQYLQQGLMAFLYDMLDRSPTSSVRDQRPNQLLARVGSLDGSYATVDLSEASDRMSYQLVESLFKGTAIWPLLNASRTKLIGLPDGTPHPMVKFSSMGSAVNFPLQVMVYTAVISAVHARLGLNKRPFRVYGDDLIVPVEAVEQVVEELEYYGFKVNTKKSYWTGFFRESCGADWYHGTNVTPTYWRRDATGGTLSDGLASVVAFRNQLYHRHIFSSTVEALDGYLRGRGLSYNQCASTGCIDGVLCGPGNSRVRWNKALQRAEIRALSLEEKKVSVAASDEAKLMAALTWIGQEDISGDRLDKHSRPKQLVPRFKWTALGRVA